MASMPNAQQDVPTWRELLLGNQSKAVWAICLGIALHAFNWFVVNTATPSAILDLGGAELLSWVTAFYLVFSILGSSGASFLKARIGIRVLLPGSTLALILGCAMIALAPSMEVLLAGRIVQGLAEGIIYALSYIVAAEAIGHRALPALWALLALVWAVATILGPIVSGAIIELLSWRWATGALIVPAAMFVWLAVTVLPKTPSAPSASIRWPLARLVCLAGGCLALSMASEAHEVWLASATSFGAVAMIALGLVIDRRAASGLFPKRLLSLDTTSAQGLGLLAMMMLADAPAFLFTPYVVQVHFGMSAMIAGQIATLTAIGWSFSALAIARAPEKLKAPMILAGPLSLLFGLAGYAVALGVSSLWTLGASLLLIGVGFGVSHGFISQKTIAHSALGEEDVTSGGIPTIEGLGAAIGAALAGICANAAGFPSEEHGLNPFVVTATAAAFMVLPAVWLGAKFAAAAPSPKSTQPAASAIL